MSEQDQVRPYHAKDSSSGQETAETLAQVLKHAAARDEAAKQKTTPRKQPRWMLPLGVGLGPLALYLLIAPPAWVVLNPIQPPVAEAQVQGLRTAMYLQANRIESYRNANGRLPQSLAECCNAYEGIDYYVRGANTYQLIGSVGEDTVSYDSSQSLNEWASDLNLVNRIQG